jgi:hypothetical protein
VVEDKNDSSSLSYADIDDNNNDDSINTLEKTTKKVVTEIKEVLSSGAKAAEKKVVPPIQDITKERGQQNDVEKVVKGAVNEAKEIIQEGTRSAEQKIKEAQDLIDAKQTKAEERLAAENISKMGGLATQFTNSFEDVLYEIRTRTYAEQEQIYIGFLKLIDQQRELIVARKDLATRLKASVRKPVVVIGSEDIDKLPKNVEIPQLQGQQQQPPQLPAEMVNQEQSKEAEPLIMDDEPTEQTGVIQESSQHIEGSTEIPAAEIQSSTSTDDEKEESKKKFQSTKKSKYNKKFVKTRTSE